MKISKGHHHGKRRCMATPKKRAGKFRIENEIVEEDKVNSGRELLKTYSPS